MPQSFSAGSDAQKPSVFFLTFGNELCYGSVTRLCQFAQRCKIIDRVFPYTDVDLRAITNFWEQHGQFIKNNARGYGYWLWKAFLIQKMLHDEMRDGDVLVYADAGCTWHDDAKNLHHLIDLARASASGVVATQISHKEATWNKADLFKYLNVEQTHTETGQVAATSILMIKTASSVALADKWYETATAQQYHFIDDSPSILPNHVSFREHRHDQSIFSLLFKQHGGCALTYDQKALEDSRWKQRGDSVLLSAIGKKYGTDKVSHGFADLYDERLRLHRFRYSKVLEIGVFFGASLLMWREFFPNATIHGMDTFAGVQGNGRRFENADKFLKEHQSDPKERIELHQVDQSDRRQLQKFVEQCVAENCQFDLIVDDASHLMRDQQQSLGMLFPLLKPGGIFIVEDLHTSYTPLQYDVNADLSNSTLLMLKKFQQAAGFQSAYLNDDEIVFLNENVADIDIKIVNNSQMSATCFITK